MMMRRMLVKKGGFGGGDRHERTVVILSLVVAFSVLLFLVLFLSKALLEREDLKTQSEAERSFNSIYLAIQDGDNAKAKQTMDDEKVIGIGIYNSMGRRILSLGTVPQVLSVSQSMLKNSSQQINTGVISYNKESGRIEYVRYSRLNILLDTGNLSLGTDGMLSVPIDFPDVLYVVMDGTTYHKQVVGIKFLGSVAALLLCVLLVVVIKIYLKNREYRQMLEKQESLVSLGQAARTLTHEIKNPLSAITLQLALLKKTLPSQYDGDIVILDTEVKRLTLLTNKISDFLKNPVGSPVPIDLNALLQGIIDTFARPIPIVSSGNERIRMDSDRARSVFENLLKNALESCSDRDPQVKVVIETDKKKNLHVLVLDRGDGIAKENERKIFDPFFTTKIHGSGIGLAISRQFVSASGGEIRLRSRDGGGTIAEVVMPTI
jgi:two-component system sensor histidine kinase HydH